MASARRRLDVEVHRRGLADSRARARALIESGRILVNNAPADKPGRMVAPGDAVRLLGPPARFVSRGGDKLAPALERFGLGRGVAVAVDAGSSTGGFTDALLQAGVGRVIAIDVGRAQLHERLRADPRVESRERTDIRDVAPADIGGPVPLVVADLSFISLRTVLDALLGLLDDGGDLVVLVKPQFEAGREAVGRGRGVIRDPQVWTAVLTEVWDAIRGRRAVIMDGMVSPLRGSQGNVEFLVHVRHGATSAPVDGGLDIPALIAEAMAEGD